MMITSRWWPVVCAIAAAVGMVIALKAVPQALNRPLWIAATVEQRSLAGRQMGTAVGAMRLNADAQYTVDEMLDAPNAVLSEWLRSREAMSTAQEAEVAAIDWLMSEGVPGDTIERTWTRRVTHRELDLLEQSWSGGDRYRATWIVFFEARHVGPMDDDMTLDDSGASVTPTPWPDDVPPPRTAGYVSFDATSGEWMGYAGQNLAMTSEPAATLASEAPEATYGIEAAKQRLYQLFALLLAAMVIGGAVGYTWRRRALQSA